MSDTQDDRKKLEAAITEEALKSKHIQDLGQKVKVERHSIQEHEHMDKLREVIGDVGKNLQEIGVIPPGVDYMGSFSIHVFKSETLRTILYATVNNDKNIPYDVADGAMRELNGNVKVAHSRSRPKLRSGF